MKSTTSTLFTLILLGGVCLSPSAFAATSETGVVSENIDQTNTAPVEDETVTEAIDGTEETAEEKAKRDQAARERAKGIMKKLQLKLDTK